MPRPLLLICLGITLALLTGLAGCGGETRRAETETESAASAVPTTPKPSAQIKSIPVAKMTDPRRRAYVDRTDGSAAASTRSAAMRANGSASLPTSRAPSKPTSRTPPWARRSCTRSRPSASLPGEATLLAPTFSTRSSASSPCGPNPHRPRRGGCAAPADGCGPNSTTSAARSRPLPVAMAGAPAERHEASATAKADAKPPAAPAAAEPAGGDRLDARPLPRRADAAGDAGAQRARPRARPGPGGPGRSAKPGAKGATAETQATAIVSRTSPAPPP